MKHSNRGMWILVPAIFLALGGFLALYLESLPKVEEPKAKEGATLENWTIEESAGKGSPLRENKGIYQEDNRLYDVYLSVFPTRDEKGELLDFSAFDLHQARDHSYNPVLNCNIQILPEGKKPDPLVSLDKTNATIRVRGNSSRGDTYKSYKIKLLEETDSFYGQTILNINKHGEDLGKIATKLCTELLTDMEDICSYRTYFMRVWIRDASLPESEQKFRYYGLYTEIEQPNKTYLEVRGLPSHGVMYKARNFNFSLAEPLKNVDAPDYDQAAFESVLGIREAKDHKKLLHMLRDLNDETKDFESVFHRYFNEENYLTFVAFSLLTGNYDIINHNFILYSPQNAETWYLLPWDFDATLRFGQYENPLMQLPISLQGGQKLNQSVLHRRYFRMEGSREKLQRKMEQLLEFPMTEERIQGLVGEYLPVLEKTMLLQPDLHLLLLPPDELPQYLYSIHDGMVSNYEAFLEAGEYPAPMYVAVPTVNGDSTLHLAWEPSYSYQGRTVSYRVTIYRDYGRQEKVYEKDRVLETQLDTEEPLEPGIYYLDVRAVDSQGHEQMSLERFETVLPPDGQELLVNGLLQFEVR